MKIAKKLYALAAFIAFGSNCFGAKEIRFEKLGYTVFVRGFRVAYSNNNNENEWYYIKENEDINQGSATEKEIFEFAKNTDLKDFLLIFPIGIYKFSYGLGEERIYLTLANSYSDQECFSKVGKFFFFLDKTNNKLYFASQGDKVICEYPLENLEFKMGSIHRNIESILIWRDNTVNTYKYNLHKNLTLDEINQKYSELLSKEFEEFEVVS